MELVSLGVATPAAVRSDYNEGSSSAIEASPVSRVVSSSDDLLAFRERIAHHAERFALQYQARKTALHEGDESFLERGCIYAQDYFNALVQMEGRDVKRKRKRFVENSTILIGMPPRGMKHLIRSEEDMQLWDEWKSEFKEARIVHRQMGPVDPYCYVIEEGYPPSSILDSLEEELSFIDCRMAVEIAIYKALRETVGDEIFDAYFSSPEHPFILSTKDFDKTPFARLLTSITRLTNRRVMAFQDRPELEDGDICFFSNHRLYVATEKCGLGSGYWTVYSKKGDRQTYTAFGLDPHQTEVEVLQNLVKVTNEALEADFDQKVGASTFVVAQFKTLIGVESYGMLARKILANLERDRKSSPPIKLRDFLHEGFYHPECGFQANDSYRITEQSFRRFIEEMRQFSQHRS